MGNKFDQTDYWIKRHERFEGDPRSIGNAGKSFEENAEGDQLVARWVHEAAKALSYYSDVLDIGCGYGRTASAFCEHGFNYHGVDVSPLAILKAQEAVKSLNARFEVADLSIWKAKQQYDLVCALFVFVHFVDDSAWRSMLERVLEWVRPGGGFLLAESSFPERIEQRVPHAKRRPISAYEMVFAEAGFELRPHFAELVAARLPNGAKRPNCYLAQKTKLRADYKRINA